MSKDAEIEYADVGDETYMYRLSGDDIRWLTIDIAGLLSEMTKPLLRLTFGLYGDNIGGGEPAASAELVVVSDLDGPNEEYWGSLMLRARSSSGVLENVLWFPTFVVDLTDHKTESVGIALFPRQRECDTYMYLDRWIQLFEKKG